MGRRELRDELIFPDRSRERDADGPIQLWVADLTYIAILAGFVYPNWRLRAGMVCVA